MFPYLPHQPGYNKRLRAALPLVKQVIRDLAADSDFWFDDVWIADSTRSSAAARAPPSSARTWRAGRTTGYCASHSRWFWGLRLYLICTPAGMPVLWALADPKIGERKVLATMLDVEPGLAASRPGLILITDKGFSGRQTRADLAASGITLLRPSRKDEAARHGEPLLKTIRQLIESVNDT
ncbi:MAG TPA: IS982 family transposase, partial [Actinobacteria bacterium]|nr:IS982 family transposase [Actinomycetota bacterium]